MTVLYPRPPPSPLPATARPGHHCPLSDVYIYILYYIAVSATAPPYTSYIHGVYPRGTANAPPSRRTSRFLHKILPCCLSNVNYIARWQVNFFSLSSAFLFFIYFITIVFSLPLAPSHPCSTARTRTHTHTPYDLSASSPSLQYAYILYCTMFFILLPIVHIIYIYYIGFDRFLVGFLWVRSICKHHGSSSKHRSVRVPKSHCRQQCACDRGPRWTGSRTRKTFTTSCFWILLQATPKPIYRFCNFKNFNIFWYDLIRIFCLRFLKSDNIIS